MVEDFKEAFMRGMGYMAGFLVTMAVASAMGAMLTYWLATSRKG